jgi:hypothetical protein
MILQTYLLNRIVTQESIRSIYKKAVRNLSYIHPKPGLNMSHTCPGIFLQKCSLVVLNRPYTSPIPVRNLSAEKRKKQTTPFGGMARPYYSLAPHPHPSLHQSFHIAMPSLFLTLKFSQEYC